MLVRVNARWEGEIIVPFFLMPFGAEAVLVVVELSEGTVEAAAGRSLDMMGSMEEEVCTDTSSVSECSALQDVDSIEFKVSGENYCLAVVLTPRLFRRFRDSVRGILKLFFSPFGIEKPITP
jgi:hypothetical protein